MSALAWAVALGATAGLGLWSLASRVPRFGRPRLAARLAPFLVDVSAEARRLRTRRDSDPLPALGVLGAPALDAFQRVFGSLLGGSASTAARLRRAGLARSVAAERARQMLWTGCGALVGAAAAAVGIAAHGGLGQAAVVAPIVGAGAGLLASDRLLRRRGDRRAARLVDELPVVLEFLALSLSAGEGVHDAVRRVARVGSGELPTELSRVAAEVSVGVPLAAALTRLADELRIAPLTRSVAQVVGALQRGAPLADLLRVQAADAREEARRRLLEAAGRKEIGMLVPLVFLILPATVAFAVFPGLVVLQTQL